MEDKITKEMEMLDWVDDHPQLEDWIEENLDNGNIEISDCIITIINPNVEFRGYITKNLIDWWNRCWSKINNM
jgi:hypothetical protein